MVCVKINLFECWEGLWSCDHAWKKQTLTVGWKVGSEHQSPVLKSDVLLSHSSTQTSLRRLFRSSMSPDFIPSFLLSLPARGLPHLDVNRCCFGAQLMLFFFLGRRSLIQNSDALMCTERVFDLLHLYLPSILAVKKIPFHDGIWHKEMEQNPQSSLCVSLCLIRQCFRVNKWMDSKKKRELKKTGNWVDAHLTKASYWFQLNFRMQFYCNGNHVKKGSLQSQHGQEQ